MLKILLCLALVAYTPVLCGPFDWMGRDNFDDLIERMDRVTYENCDAQDESDLVLPTTSVTNKIMFNKLKTTVYFKNRTQMEQMHAVSLGNAYKYSFLFQRYNETTDSTYQPSLFYYYFGLTADVSGNNGYINGSAAFFDNHLFYPNFYKLVALNNTIGLFGPRAYRIDDWNDPSNWLREPTNYTFNVEDYGAGLYKNYTSPKYKVNTWYGLWLPQPESESDTDKNEQFSIRIKRANGTGSYNQESNQNFFGPPAPGADEAEEKQPTLFTRPYFDCGRSNKWIVSAVTAIYDLLPRYPVDPVTSLPLINVQKYRRVGVTVVDIDFLRIDFNPCLPDAIFPEDNYLGGTARCKLESTLCRPLHGAGYLRGSYMCECRPGYRYPVNIQGPYYGWDIEKATKDEYDAGFHCLQIGDLYVVPNVRADEVSNAGFDTIPGIIVGKRSVDGQERMSKETANRLRRSTSYASRIRPIRAHDSEKLLVKESERFRRALIGRKMSIRYTEAEREAGEARRRVVRHSDIREELKEQVTKTRRKRGFVTNQDYAKNRRKRATFDPVAYNKLLQYFIQKDNVEKSIAECESLPKEDLILPGEARFGVDEMFEAQALTAVRIANFLSNFLQNINGYTDYGLLTGDHLLSEDQVLAEVLGPMMADPKILALAVYFDENKFMKRDKTTKELFAPMAYRLLTKEQVDTFHAVDLAGEPEMYSRTEWFESVKFRWSYNTDGLQKNIMNPWIRSDQFGRDLKKHEEYPILWRSPRLQDGVWSDPYFNCKGYVKKWMLTYRVPFFGRNPLSNDVEFKGVVAVDVDLDRLDLKQCASDFYEPNAFMGTARCDYETTQCAHVTMIGFRDGPGYRCDCKQGYEYPWLSSEYFYTGDLINQELYRKRLNLTSRYDRLKCRMSDASSVRTTFLLPLALLLLWFSY